MSVRLHSTLVYLEASRPALAISVCLSEATIIRDGPTRLECSFSLQGCRNGAGRNLKRRGQLSEKGNKTLPFYTKSKMIK